MSSDSVLRAVEALNAGDLDGYGAAFSPDAQRTVPGVVGPISVGASLDQLRALRAAFEGMRLDPALMLDADPYVIVRWRMTGTHTGALGELAPTGRRIDVESCEIYECHDGKVIRSWAYGDPSELVAQLTGEADL